MKVSRVTKVLLVAGLPILLSARIASPGCRSDRAVLVFAPADHQSAQNPAYSPDGQAILFTVFHSGYNRGGAGLYTLSVDGGTPAALLDESGHDSVNLPGSSWNAATGRITFSSDRQDTDEVWTVDPDGTSLFRVTHQIPPFLHYQEPSFSPDGQWIAFEAVTSAPELARRGSIWKVRADGSDLTQLIDGSHTASAAGVRAAPESMGVHRRR